ncbi:hypothetical protein Tsubulata_001657 [Turnera subulata]|uniref:Uncharacterized protein n=1 Tax=Turnera subulata TaxID=218843 RepID=A0A9Q0FU15_9ROSI|nr:hypothetical protein Tsubulata_001657 [Turnera subulata]
MGRAAASCEKDEEVKKGRWSAEEDEILRQTIHKHGVGSWQIISKKSGLRRNRHSCRFRWVNYLCPDIKRGPFSPEEESQIIQLQATLGNKWSVIASKLPGRTDNDVRSWWLAKKPCSTTLPNEEKWHINDQPKEKPQINDHPSEVGESFRNIKGKVDGACNSSGGGVGSSSVDQLAMPFKTSTVCASTATSLDQLEDSCEPKLGVVMAAGLDSISSDAFAHSSDSFLKLLSDSPEGNDMEYLQGQGHSFSDPCDVDAADKCVSPYKPQIL